MKGLNIPDRSRSPFRGIEAPDEQLVIRHELLSLPNRMPLYVLPGDGPEIIRLDLVVPAGVRYQHHPLAAVFTARLLREGTQSTHGDIIAERLDYYGAYLEATAERDKAVVSLYAPRRFFGEVLPLFAEVWNEASFPEDVLEVEKKHQLQEYQVNDRRVAWVARQHFNARLFGYDHPYGLFPAADDFGRVEQFQLREHFERCYASEDAYLILSGSVDVDAVNMVASALGQRILQPAMLNGKALLSEGIHHPDRIEIVRQGAVQSALRMGRIIMPRGEPGFMGMQFLVTLLGGYFGSRLMKNIREDKGYTYGIGAFIMAYQHSASLVISSEVGTEVLEDALGEIRKELILLSREPASTEEIERVRNYILGSLQRSLDGSISRAERLRNLLDAGEPADHFLRIKEFVQKVDPMELMRLATGYLDPDRLITLVVGAGSDEKRDNAASFRRPEVSVERGRQ
ncbi:MAG: insulinase family protein [Bacteroidales bacterium]|nr:insulinase family protein [Bacteroidales bacterium]